MPLYLGGADRGGRDRARDRLVVSRRGGLRFDTAVGVLFAGTFAFGVLLFSTIKGYVTRPARLPARQRPRHQRSATSSRSRSSGAIVLAVVLVLRKELLYATFDPLGAAASGLPVRRLEYLLLGLLGVTIVVSIQAVGIIMVVAMLVTPAATAQLLVVRFDRLMVARGRDRRRVGRRRAVRSASTCNVASGASIVLVETVFFVVALVLSPRSGLLRSRGSAGGPMTIGWRTS